MHSWSKILPSLYFDVSGWVVLVCGTNYPLDRFLLRKKARSSRFAALLSDRIQEQTPQRHACSTCCPAHRQRHNIPPPTMYNPITTFFQQRLVLTLSYLAMLACIPLGLPCKATGLCIPPPAIFGTLPLELSLCICGVLLLEGGLCVPPCIFIPAAAI